MENPKVNRLNTVAPDLPEWASMLRDGANLLDILSEQIQEEMTPQDLERCLTLFRSAFVATDSAIGELNSLYQFLERDLTPCPPNTRHKT